MESPSEAFRTSRQHGGRRRQKTTKKQVFVTALKHIKLKHIKMMDPAVKQI